MIWTQPNSTHTLKSLRVSFCTVSVWLYNPLSLDSFMEKCWACSSWYIKGRHLTSLPGYSGLLCHIGDYYRQHLCSESSLIVSYTRGQVNCSYIHIIWDSVTVSDSVCVRQVRRYVAALQKEPERFSVPLTHNSVYLTLLKYFLLRGAVKSPSPVTS